ncbi:HAAS signaling domain-containing protein [Actinomadura hibisca]|uniref:HAAS signaling domain-containing protein n=1 Tax=Actinomadura hibisca TaxID=68565 RepID=UPI00082BAEF5|nr:permease prefix domain 1-containing protein [Actinomadura hibisca]
MSTDTLTERYVHEVVRRIPAGQRDDIADELRATIADTVEGHRDADPAAAERAVLTEMGDPVRLAARYSGRPLALIGPELYPAYLRLLKLLLATVLPLVTVAASAVDLLDGKGAGDAVGAGIGAFFVVGAQLVAWPTVVFALIERTRRDGEPLPGTPTWTPDDLPEVPQQEGGRVAGMVSAVWNALLLGLIVWQHTAEPVRTDGKRLQVLDPALWSGWIWPVLAGLAALVAIDLVRVGTRGWTVPLAAAHAVAQAVFALPLAWILHERLFFNPEFLGTVNGGLTVRDEFYTVAALGVLVVAGHEVFKGLRAARKQAA